MHSGTWAPSYCIHCEATGMRDRSADSKVFPMARRLMYRLDLLKIICDHYSASCDHYKNRKLGQIDWVLVKENSINKGGP